MIACLSPNGGVESRGDGPALTLMVATLRGVVRFDRKSLADPWRETARSLEGHHISCLLYEPQSRLLFAGCHGVVIALITNPSFGYVDTEEFMGTMIDGLTRGLIDPPR